MDPRLVGHYGRELQFLREMGAEFAREFPKIAARLGMDGIEVADPYVERLLEGVAFLTARVQLKIEDQFQSFTQHLLEVVYPHVLAPTPSMAVVQFQPNLREGSLIAGVPIPRGTPVRSLLGKNDQTACEYRTAHEVTLLPLEVAAAEWRSNLADLRDVRFPGFERVRAVFRLHLRTVGGVKISQLALDRLPLFLRGPIDLATRLHERLIAHTAAVVVRPRADRSNRSAPVSPTLIRGKSIRALGLEPEEGLLPHDRRSFHGHRLLHEYFTFPNRLLFAELTGLESAIRRIDTEELEILVLLESADSTLEGAVAADHVALFATPAVNIFPRSADRIHLTEAQHELHVVPDRTRPVDFEVYSVGEVVGYGVGGVQQRREFLPLYGVTEASAGREEAHFTLRREPRRPSDQGRVQGPRSSYVGSEVFLSVVDDKGGPFRSDLQQLGIELLCTNRDLPLLMPLQVGRTDFTLDLGAPVESIRCIAGPTPPKPSTAQGRTAWHLVSHLSLNYLALTEGEKGAQALRTLLSLYGDQGEGVTRRQVEGVVSVTSQSIVRRLPLAGPVAYGRGLEVTVTLDEAAFQGVGTFLLGSVLERFFAEAVSINSFTETVLRTIQRGEVHRWPTRVGRAPLL